MALAIINISFANSTGKSKLAVAGIVVDPIDTSGIVNTRIGLAFVNVDFAIDSCNKRDKC